MFHLFLDRELQRSLPDLLGRKRQLNIRHQLQQGSYSTFLYFHFPPQLIAGLTQTLPSGTLDALTNFHTFVVHSLRLLD